MQKLEARFGTRNYTYEKGSMTGILTKLKWESLQKRRKVNRIILLYKGLKGRAKYPQMTVSPKIGVVGINTPWHFRYLQQVQMSIYIVFPQTIRDWNELPDSLISSAEMSEMIVCLILLLL